MTGRGKKNPIRSKPNLTEDTPLSDVVWGNVDVNEYDDISLVPLDETEERQRPRHRESLLPLGTVSDEEIEPPIDLKFSLRHILIGQAIIAACLGVMRIFGLFAPGGFAGTLGILSIIFAVLISVHDPDDKRTILVWWALFVFYLLACIVAFAVG